MTVTRRSLIARSAVAGAVAAGSAAAAVGGTSMPAWGRGTDGEPLPIVTNGQGRAKLVVPDDPSDLILLVADELVEHVRLATGVTLPIVTQAQDRTVAARTPIHVGCLNPRSANTVTDALADLAPDGFVIDSTCHVVTILGPTESGTANGVYAFLERVLDVIWLMPTTLGTDVPSTSEVSVPPATIRDAPAFAMRQCSPMSGRPGEGAQPDHGTWAHRNRLQGNHNRPFEFHHNLWSLFPVEEFGQTHPEFYPNATPPAPGVRTGWQPAFTVPETVDVAAAKIIDHFDQNPEAVSFSLGVNDSRGYAESDPVEPYYQWVNAVVAQVRAVHPDKWFGLLAYFELEEPPTFALDPHIVPFFTQDRGAWVVPAVRDAALAKLLAWQEVAASVGFYDYVYGSPYLVPRTQHHLYADMLQRSRDAGVSAYYAELYPYWGEGPKPWLLTQLLWDPDRDVDTLLARWYKRAVGLPAAAPLAQYFSVWEEFWADTVPTGEWFDPELTYLPFRQLQYLDQLDDSVLDHCRGLLDEVVALAGPGAQRERAEMLRRSFAYYDTAVRSWPKPVEPPTTTAEALAIVDGVEANWEARLEAIQARVAMVAANRTDPLLGHLIVHNFTWAPIHHSELWTMVDHLRSQEPDGGPVTDWLTARASGESIFNDYVRLVLGIAGGTTTSLLVNGSFEDGAGTAVPPWNLWVATAGELSHTTATARTGNGAIVANGLARGGPNQVHAIEEGLVATRSWVRAGAGHAASAQSVLHLRNSDGRNLNSILGGVVPLARRGEGWTAIDSLESVPASIGTALVSSAQFVLTLDRQSNDPPLYVDDCQRFQAGPIPPVADGNLLVNAGFETAAGSLPQGWTVTAGEVRLDSGDVFEGERCVVLDDDSTTQPVGLRSSVVEAGAGETYEASVAFRSDAGNSSLYLEFWNAAGTRIAAPAVAGRPTGGWERARCTGVAPNGTAKVSVLLWRTSAETGVSRFDDATLHRMI